MTNFEIRANIHFLTKLDWKPVVIIKSVLQIYCDFSACKALVYDWMKRFKEGREQYLQDDPRERSSFTEKKVKEALSLS